MRVLFFTHTFAPDYTGGAEVSLYHTCRGLQQRGVDGMVLAVNRRRPRPVDQWYDLDGIPVRRVNFSTSLPWAGFEVFDWRVFRQVRRELLQLRPHIFHVHNVAEASLAPFVAAWSTGTPTICTLHDHWLLCPNNMLYRGDGSSCDPAQHADRCGQCYRQILYWGVVPRRRQTLAWLTRSVARFISPSQALIDLHVAAGYDRSRFRHVPNALAAPDASAPTHAGVDAFAAAAAGKPALVFAGGGVSIKGARLLLDALPGLLQALPDAQIAIAGGGDVALIQEFNRLGPSIHTLGPVPFNAMRSLYALADLTLLPSVWQENSPMVIYENYQVGTPVVGSAIGGIPELIEPGQTGYLFAPGQAQDLIDQVVAHFRRPPHARRAMRHACIVKARGELTLARHLDGVEAVYAEVIGPQARLAMREAAV